MRGQRHSRHIPLSTFHRPINKTARRRPGDSSTPDPIVWASEINFRLSMCPTAIRRQALAPRCSGAVRSVPAQLRRLSPSHATPWQRMNSVLLCWPPSMQANDPRSILTVCNNVPPPRTRTQRLFGTSAYQTAPSASMQMPSGRHLQDRPRRGDSTGFHLQLCRMP